MLKRIHLSLMLIFSMAGLRLDALISESPTVDFYANYKKIIEVLSEKDNLDDSSISDQDRTTVDSEGGSSSVYGEITFEGVLILLEHLKLTEADIFCDLGSGLGKLALQVFFMSPCHKVMGVELAQARWQKAHSIEKKAGKLYVSTSKFENDMRKVFEKQALPKVKKTLHYLNDSFLKADISEPTVFFTCSTCFSDDCMRSLTERFAQLNNGVRVLTLRKLADNKNVHLVKTFYLPMTWSPRTAVYMYKVDHNNVPAVEEDYDPFNLSIEKNPTYLPDVLKDETETEK